MDEYIKEYFTFGEVNHYILHGKCPLTTGEMLDSIEVGQVAERIYEPEGYCSDAYTKLKIDEAGDLLFFSEQEKDWNYERLTGVVIKSKWRIVNE